MKHYGSTAKPDIFNSDQGSQFTSIEFTNRLKAEGIQISMDGRGRALDNIFVERLWRSVKYEDAYLHDYTTVPEAILGLKSIFCSTTPSGSTNRWITGHRRKCTEDRKPEVSEPYARRDRS